MLLTIRVTIAILFSGFVLWSQTLDGNLNAIAPAAETKLLKDPSSARPPAGSTYIEREFISILA